MTHTAITGTCSHQTLKHRNGFQEERRILAKKGWEKKRSVALCLSKCWQGCGAPWCGSGDHPVGTRWLEADCLGTWSRVANYTTWANQKTLRLTPQGTSTTSVLLRSIMDVTVPCALCVARQNHWSLQTSMQRHFHFWFITFWLFVLTPISMDCEDY